MKRPKNESQPPKIPASMEENKTAAARPDGLPPELPDAPAPQPDAETAALRAEAQRLVAEANQRLSEAKVKTAELEQREGRATKREQALDQRDAQVNKVRTENEQTGKLLDQREQKAKQRQNELDAREEKCRSAERELKRKEGELESRTRVVQEREQEADAGFAAKNRAALAAMEKEHAQLRTQLEALRHELQQARERGFAALDADLAREREQRHKALDEELRSNREREERRLKASLDQESSRAHEAFERRSRELEQAAAALEDERKKWLAERQKLQEQQRTEADGNKARLDQREQKLEEREHRLKIGEALLAQDQARLQDRIEEGSRARVEELTARLETVDGLCKERLEQILRLEKRLEAYRELEKRFADQAPEEILAEREQLRRSCERLRRELEARPTAEDKQQLEVLLATRDKLEQELTEARRKLATLSTERTRWALSVSELEHQRNLKEAAERIQHALDAQNKRLSEEVERVRKLYEAPQDRSQRIESIEKPWHEALVRAEEDAELTETAWLDRIVDDCKGSGLEFPRRLVLAFHTALKTSDWSPIAVLAGVSGTGKSELPRLYSRFGGLGFMPRPVQPNWDSPQSLFGFFNSIDNRFDATPLLQALVQSQKSQDDPGNPHGFADRLLLVLLDEMNLAHVEQYFSDLLSKLEERRGMKDCVSIDIELGGGLKYPLPLGRNVLWVGTMNEDETTKSLSDKVIDRSNLIYFPRPQKLRRRLDAALRPPRPLLPRAAWERWIIPKSPFTDEDVAPYKEALEQMNGFLEKVGRALGHRIWQATEHYMANHPDVVAARSGTDTEAKKKSMNRAFEDQLVQKVMPKLRGIETSGDARSKCLDPVNRLLGQMGLNLAEDFAISMRVGAGSFIWNSARYVEAEA